MNMISIIIPTYNRNDLLVKCLECLNPTIQDCGENKYEVIVTDDSKENIAKDLIFEKFNWVNWAAGPKQGPAANRNSGASKATGDWILFIDDDCLPDKDIVKEYSRSIALYKGTLVFEGRTGPDRPQRRFDEECPSNETGGYLWSCNFMINKETFFTDLKGFDENFPYAAMEDVDLCYRLKKLGIDIVFLPQASVIHPWRKQTKTFRATLHRYKSYLCLLDKHPEKSVEINVYSLLRVFYNISVKQGILKLTVYKFRGFSSLMTRSFMSAVFSLYLLFRYCSKRRLAPL